MNYRLILLISAVVAFALTAFFSLRSGNEKSEGPPDTSDKGAEVGLPPRPSSDGSVTSKSEVTEEKAALAKSEKSNEEPVARAIDIVTSVGPKRRKAKDSNGTEQVPQRSEPDLQKGTLELGLHPGITKIAPELKEIAQKGAIAVANQNWKEAREIYLEMINRAPDDALAYANLGVAEFQLGNLVAASGNLKRSLDLNQSIAQNWQTLGLIQYEQGKMALAISSLSRAVHEAPNNAQSRVFLAAVIRDYGWEEAALTELQRAIQVDPELADAHYNLAVTYLSMNPPRIELAKRHYYSAVDLGAEPSPDFEKSLQSSP
tara:strand:+ start:2560 stop:3510 length:951 start_codon:yes stop_codon:yes gene_type:complete